MSDQKCNLVTLNFSSVFYLMLIKNINQKFVVFFYVKNLGNIYSQKKKTDFPKTHIPIKTFSRTLAFFVITKTSAMS